MTDHPTRDVERPELEVGDLIRIHPHNGGTRWWTVQAVDDRYAVATRPAAFGKPGETRGDIGDDPVGRPTSSDARRDLVYTVIDWTGWADRVYNGAGHGPVRSSLNTLGGGYDIDPERPQVAAGQILRDLASGTYELSHRRVVDVERVEVKGAAR